MAFRSHYDLQAYQRAYALSLDIYKISADFPGEEKFGIVNQMRRAA